MITRGTVEAIIEYAEKHVHGYRQEDGTYNLRELGRAIQEFYDLPPTAVDTLDLYNLLAEIAMEDEGKERHTHE